MAGVLIDWHSWCTIFKVVRKTALSLLSSKTKIGAL